MGTGAVVVRDPAAAAATRVRIRRVRIRRQSHIECVVCRGTVRMGVHVRVGVRVARVACQEHGCSRRSGWLRRLRRRRELLLLLLMMPHIIITIIILAQQSPNTSSVMTPNTRPTMHTVGATVCTTVGAVGTQSVSPSATAATAAASGGGGGGGGGVMAVRVHVLVGRVLWRGHSVHAQWRCRITAAAAAAVVPAIAIIATKGVVGAVGAGIGIGVGVGGCPSHSPPTPSDQSSTSTSTSTSTSRASRGGAKADPSSTHTVPHILGAFDVSPKPTIDGPDARRPPPK